jgi:hypothetical protein
LSKFVLQAARSTSPRPTIQLVFCLPGYSTKETHYLGQLSKFGIEQREDLVYSSNGVDFAIVGFVEKPCITHYRKIRESKICRKCSPARLWTDRGFGYEMAYSHWVDLEEWTGQWMETL